MTNVCAPQYSERTEAPSEGLMIGSNNTFLYTASLCECSSWRKFLTGGLETTDARKEKHGHIKRFVLLHCQYDHVLLQELKLFIEKEMPFLFVCMRQIRAPLPSLKAKFSSGSSWDSTRKTLPSFPIYFSHDLNSDCDERTFLWGPFHVWFLCWNC